jgi:ribonuclease HII
MLISKRLKAFDDELREQYGSIIVGCDEAGRGSLAGPIAACAVVLPANQRINGLDDSKKLSHVKRLQLSKIIKEVALSWHVEMIEADEIDEKGLTWANSQVMLRAAQKVTEDLGKIDLYIIDQSPKFELKPHIMMPKADGISLSVAAASVLAKTTRDLLMIELNKTYTGYDLDNSKGYISPAHKEGIEKRGLVKGLHRFSYNIK